MSMKSMESPTNVDRIPLVDTTASLVIYPIAQPHWFIRFKRLLDLTMSGTGLFMLIPLFAAIYVLIKCENPRGPVFFSQTRVGKDGKTFKMYKFRTMVMNAEQLKEKLLHLNEVSGAMFKMKNDPRITRIGRILRKSSLDELPQLWNVIKGDMSLVGPRPPLPDEVASYSTHDMQRLAVLPGCTGLWQVSGRNHVGFGDMVEFDLQYIRQQSIIVDLRILLKTVRVMFGTKDAF